MMAMEIQLNFTIVQLYLQQDQILITEDTCTIQWMQRLVKQQIHYGYLLEQVTMKELEILQQEFKT